MKYKCPHCKKVLDLGKVIEKQAQNLADQEIDKKLKIEKQFAEKKGAKDAEKKIKAQYKEEALRTKNIEEENKKLKQQREEDKKKIAASAAEAAKATEFEAGQKRLKIQDQKHQDEKQKWKLKEERYISDAENLTRRAEQGLTADQGTGAEITMGNYLEKIFKDSGDEIIVFGKGEAGGRSFTKN